MRSADSGYRRDGAPNIERWDAVSWWYVVREDDYVFARGGRVRTTRDARERLRQARNEHARDREVSRRQKRLRHKLGPDGELVRL